MGKVKFLLLWNQIGGCLLILRKVSLLTSVCGEGKYSIFFFFTLQYCIGFAIHQQKVQYLLQAPSKENGQLMLKRPELHDGFQGSLFKDS